MKEQTSADRISGLELELTRLNRELTTLRKACQVAAEALKSMTDREPPSIGSTDYRAVTLAYERSAEKALSALEIAGVTPKCGKEGG